MTLKKFFAPLTAVAVVAAVSLSLLVQATPAAAAVNGISPSATAVNSAGTLTLTIDADEGSGDVTVLATAGDFTGCTELTNAAACTLDGTSPIANFAGTADVSFITDDGAAATAGIAMDTLSVAWTAPTTTSPLTVTFTVIQGTSTKTVNVTVRGQVDKLEVSAFTGASTSTTVCTGTVAQVIQSTAATTGQANATLCTVVLDAGGNRIPSQTVVYSTTAGTITGITDTTSTTGARATTSTIAKGSTGTSGTEATITASAGGKSATVKIRFGGDPASCTVSTSPASVAPGGSTIATVDVKDATGGPAVDGAVINMNQANAGAGANAAILNTAPTTAGGKATSTVIAAINGSVAIGAASAVNNPGATCTGSLAVTGTAPAPTPGTGTGTGTTGTFSVAPVAGLTFTQFSGTTADLNATAKAAGVKTVSATSGGKMLTWVVDAPDFVNADFKAAFPSLSNTIVVTAK